MSGRLPGREDWLLLAVSGGGLGALPRAPGTWGSLGALPLWLIFSRLDQAAYLLLVLLFSGVAVYLAGAAAKPLKTTDSPVIVIDEIAGLALALTGVPLGLGNAVAAFLLFRFFDIVKPFPADWCEANLPGGFGVVADDLAAGVMAWLVLQVKILII
ncbi:MAG TPA: phosphatidylglycerophosphatase A [Proteobacteria bacterium]|nr:phosphatidylglycerophosphatase A [Pseudomonadota bacterium]